MNAAIELPPETALVVAGVSLPVPKIIDADKDNLLGKLADEIAGFKPDISTPRGRKDVASLAYKVSTTKADLIRLGKGMTEEWRRSTKAVNEECSLIEERMDALRDRVRAPLTEFENKEKARIQGHEDALVAMRMLAVFDGFVPDSELLTSALERLDAAEAGREWQEFSQRASDLHVEVGTKLTALLAEALAREEEAAAAEKRRLEAEEAARQEAVRVQREREARIAAEAAERARKEAEARAAEAAAAERQRVEQERLDAEDARRQAEIAAQAEVDALEEANRIAAEKAREAEERAARAEREAARIARENEIKRKAAQAKAEADQAAAVAAERRRQAEEAARIKREAEAKAADRENRARVHREMVADLTEHAGITAEQSRRVVQAAARGLIRNVGVQY